MSMDGCYYTTLWGEAFGWTQLLPTVVSLMLSFTSLFKPEVTFLFLGLYLHAWQLGLWSIQLYIHQDRPNPICQEYHSYAFPSIEAFYVAALVVTLVGYSVVYGYRHPIGAWLLLVFAFVAPPATLVFFAYNTVAEVLVSMGIGIVAAVIFVIAVAIYIRPATPYIINSWPLTWLGYTDSWIDPDTSRGELTMRIRKSYQAVYDDRRRSRGGNANYRPGLPYRV